MDIKEFPQKLFRKDDLLREYKLIFILAGTIATSYAIYFDVLGKTSTETIYIFDINKEGGEWFTDIKIACDEFCKHQKWVMRTAISIMEGVTKK